MQDGRERYGYSAFNAESNTRKSPGTFAEIRELARKGLNPGTTYCVAASEMRLGDNDLGSVFPGLIMSPKLMDALRRLGPWQKVDDGHWKFIAWNGDEDPRAPKDPSAKKKRGKSAANRVEWPWQKIEVKKAHTELTPEENAYFQIIIDQFGGKSFTMKEFIRLRTGRKPTLHNMVSEVVLRLWHLGFLLRHEKNDRYHYYVESSYITEEPNDESST